MIAVAAALADELDDAMLGASPLLAPAPTPPPAEPLLRAEGRLSFRLESHLGELPEDQALFAAPALLDLGVELRPVPRLRAAASGRLTHDFAVQEGDVDVFGDPVEPTTLALDQLWLKGDVGGRLWWTVGQQRIRWGSGRVWNPTDVLHDEVRDAFDPWEERLGLPLLKLHLPLGDHNLYALGRVEGAAPEDLLGALRAEAVLGPTELALLGAWGGDGHLRLGGDFSAGLGPLELHLEGVVHHGHPGPFWSGDFDPTAGLLPTRADRAGDWIPQLAGGLELGLRFGPDTLFLGAEGFWNDAGRDDPALFPWLLYKDDFVPLQNGRAYAGAYVFAPSPGPLRDIDFVLSWVGNLGDLSQVARAELRWTALGRLALRGWVAGHFGEGELALSFTVPAVDGVLEEDVSYEQPPVDLGLAAQLVF